MKRSFATLTIVLGVLMGTLTSMQSAYGGLLYMHNLTTLSTYDTQTSLTNTIGASGITDFNGGLAFDRNGNLFGLNDQDSTLYSFNLTTGAATTIGNTGLTGQGLTFTLDNRLIGVSGTDLFEINTTTAGTTLLASGFAGQFDGLTVSPVAINGTAAGNFAQGTIFGNDPSGAGTDIWAINPFTYAAVQILNDVSLNVVDESMEFDIDGVLFGHNFNRSGGLGGLTTIDLTGGGNHVFVNTTTAGVSGMSFDISEVVIPEPSTYALILTGLFGLGFMKHKRKSDSTTV